MDTSSWDSLFGQMREELMDRLESMGNISDEEVKGLIDAMLLSRSSRLPINTRVRLRKELFSSVRRLDVLQELIDDRDITEIMVNGPDKIFYEKAGKTVLWDRKFASEEKLLDVISEIVGRCNRVVNERSPIVDARLMDGSRVNAVISPAALNGPILTIRKFPDKPFTMDTLIRCGTITEEAAHFLQKMVAAGYSIVIGGGTSAGKTTFLNALSSFIPVEERIITIEDNAELQIQGISNLVRLESKKANMEGATEITIRDLIKSALRMRPDRIIVGEVRGGEAVDMLQAFNTGHDGSLCTLHANSTMDMVSRLEMMVLMAFPLPIPAIRRQIASGVDLMIHLGRLCDRSRRVLEIAEVDGMNGEDVAMHPIFTFSDDEERLIKTGDLKNTRKMRRKGL
ncbi:MAG: CpaF family protein [Lachnospiraceae bacterium]|nr:CpaF family protein [Lachnospiraceae bacterium]